MNAPTGERSIPIVADVADPDAVVVRYRRKKWPRRDREEWFYPVATDGDAETPLQAAVVRAEWWARVELPKRYKDAFDVRIVETKARP